MAPEVFGAVATRRRIENHTGSHAQMISEGII
jgi:hypothetical protein